MRTFEISDAEEAAFKEWNEKHVAERHSGEAPYHGCIGGRITYEFHCTSLGFIVIARCNACKPVDTRKRTPKPETYEANLTELSGWENFG